MACCPERQYEAAKLAGIGYESFVFIRKLLILKDQHIPQQVKAIIAEALDSVEKTRKIKHAEKMAGALIKKYWIRGKDGKAPKRQQRLDQTLITIRESCETTVDMEIPRDLSPQAARDAVVTLVASQELISRLCRRLLGDETGDETGAET
jgi:hypothetical protein